MNKRGPIYIERHPSSDNDNYGHVTAKWIKHHIDEITGDKYFITDLEEKKQNVEIM